MDKEIYVFESMNRLADHAVQIWKEVCQQSIAEHKYFSVALSGGRSPLVLYEKLSAMSDLPWDKTHVFQVDERFVPYGSDDNSYRMINMKLLRHVPILAKNVHPVFTSEASVSTSAERYEKDIRSFFKTESGRIPKFGLIILGIGEDGHTASLFPGSPALSERKRLTAVVPASGEPGHERITITFPLINNASNIVFLATGDIKAEVVRKVIEAEGSGLPASMVMPDEGRLVFLLDKGAASLLRNKTLKKG